MMPATGRGEAGERGLRERLAARLDATRSRTLALVEPLGDEDLLRRHEPTQGPVIWDLGHIANFEEQWLVQRLEGAPESRPGANDTYDPGRHPRPVRHELDLPTRAEALAYLAEVRARVHKSLPRVDLAGDALTAEGFLHEMLINHENQHQETILATLQMVPEGRYAPPEALRSPKPAAQVDAGGFVEVPGGPFEMGTPPRTPGTYDNEWPRHAAAVEPFWMGAAPVTNGEFLEFVEAGGYEDAAWWSEDGWVLRTVKGWEHPKYWTRNDAGEWFVREFDRVLPLPRRQPVCSVSWYEAEAYANWAGCRLPTEAEWEKAATWDPATGETRRYPWGDAPWTPPRANLDQRLFGPAPLGAYPEGASAVGCHQMAGDVWEWTATELHGYPGFEAFPYPEYSEAWFDRGFYVLRGGSWATRPAIARGAFRNWDTQDHRHTFAGFRLARDTPPQDGSP